MRVLLADDQERVRSALRLLLEEEQGVEVIGEAADTVSALLRAEQVQPDVILLDWELPGMAATDLLQLVRHLLPQTVVIALSGRPEARHAAEAAGVEAFVSKTAPSEKVLAALSCARGRQPVAGENDPPSSREPHVP